LTDWTRALNTGPHGGRHDPGRGPHGPVWRRLRGDGGPAARAGRGHVEPSSLAPTPARDARALPASPPHACQEGARDRGGRWRSTVRRRRRSTSTAPTRMRYAALYSKRARPLRTHPIPTRPPYNPRRRCAQCGALLLPCCAPPGWPIRLGSRWIRPVYPSPRWLSGLGARSARPDLRAARQILTRASRACRRPSWLARRAADRRLWRAERRRARLIRRPALCGSARGARRGRCDGGCRRSLAPILYPHAAVSVLRGHA
jgi:hypothetical protein